ncbi:DUF4845 domain-containing protein [Ectothiorhodospiraceae bacterium BW-2]|nr:DUF4845 domain-containing protein [Ectothiorhodospiraceae bacterium BW-2]
MGRLAMLERRSLPASNRGGSLIGIVFILFGIWVMLTFGFKLGPAYIGNMEVKSVLQQLEDDLRWQTQHSLRGRFLHLVKDSSVYTNELKADNVEVERVADKFRISVSYDAVIPIMGNLSFLIQFREQGEVTRR